MLFAQVTTHISVFQQFVVLDLLYQNHWKILLRIPDPWAQPLPTESESQKDRVIFFLITFKIFICDWARIEHQGSKPCYYWILNMFCKQQAHNKDSPAIYPLTRSDFQIAPNVCSTFLLPSSLTHFLEVSCVLGTSSWSAGLFSSWFIE